MTMGKKTNIQMTDFALRHFPNVTGKPFGGTKITDQEPDGFVKELTDSVSVKFGNMEIHDRKTYSIDDGYADFCKSICVGNFTNAKAGTLEITLENYQYLRSGYSARKEGELPVLSRWFELPLGAPRAKYLRVIVYSKEQLLAEEEELKSDNQIVKYPIVSDWGIVAILGQMGREEEPMAPATILRNAMGRSFGGSGVEIDKEKYNQSVEFWSTHANVK